MRSPSHLKLATISRNDTCSLPSVSAVTALWQISSASKPIAGGSRTVRKGDRAGTTCSQACERRVTIGFQVGADTVTFLRIFTVAVT